MSVPKAVISRGVKFATSKDSGTARILYPFCRFRDYDLCPHREISKTPKKNLIYRPLLPLLAELLQTEYFAEYCSHALRFVEESPWHAGDDYVYCDFLSGREAQKHIKEMHERFLDYERTGEVNGVVEISLLASDYYDGVKMMERNKNNAAFWPLFIGLLSLPPKPESEPPKRTETLAPDGVTIHVTVEKPTSSHVMLDYKGMEMQQLAEAILGWHFVEKHPQKVVSLVAAALDARQKHDSYRAVVMRYKEEFAAFVRQPGVEHIGGRQYRFPADLVPPKEPGPPPFPNEGDNLKFLHIDKLLGGESAESVAKEALSQAESMISSRK
jgi:hypothetical protein